MRCVQCSKTNMAAINSLKDDKWYFTKEQIENTPSRRAGLAADKELSYRQQAATLIQDMGQRLSVSQLTINTSIVYMHRFYMFFPFARFHRHAMAACCLFLAAKVEEQPRKLKHVITVAHACLHRGAPPLDTNSEEYMQQAQDLIEHESILLQTLGFEVSVHHPHTYVVKGIQLVRASKDLGQASYFMATNSLHLTTLCLQYKPTVIACACIHLACKWCNYEIPPSSDNKHWWQYLNADVTKELLDEIAHDFINIIEKCPSKLKKKINSITMLKGSNIPRPLRPNDQPTSSTGGASNGQDYELGTSSLVNDIARKYKEHNDRNEVPKPSEKKEKTKEENANHNERNISKSSSTVTSEGASVATSTTVVTLPVLPPLTTKYAAPASATAAAASQPASVSDPKVSTTSSQPSSSSTSSKHKHRSHDDGTPSKKHKSHHSSSRSHSSHKGKSSHSSDSSSSPGTKRPHFKPGHPSSSSASHKSSSLPSKHHHHHAQQPSHSGHKAYPTHRSNPHPSSHSSNLKLIPPSPTLGLLDKKRLSASNKPSPPIPRDHDAVPPPPPPPPPPSEDHPMSSSGKVFGSRQPSFFSGGEQHAPPPPPPPDPAPNSPPPPPPPPF